MLHLGHIERKKRVALIRDIVLRVDMVISREFFEAGWIFPSYQVGILCVCSVRMRKKSEFFNLSYAQKVNDVSIAQN